MLTEFIGDLGWTELMNSEWIEGHVCFIVIVNIIVVNH